MSIEIEGIIEGSKISGKESWSLDFYQERYNKITNEMPVYETKPWDIVEGSIMTFRDSETLMKLNGNGLIPCEWNEHMEIDLRGRDITITSEILIYIESNRNTIMEIPRESDPEKTWYISLPMLKLKGSPSPIVVEEEKKEEPKQYSIKVTEKDPNIIKEMISKVDRKRLHKLMAIAASYIGGKYFPKDDMVDAYLQLWAEAKYEFYLLFGKNLVLQQEVEFDIDSNEMSEMIRGLSVEFPKYGVYLSRIDTKDFISNKLTGLSSAFSSYAEPFYTRGMKVSKFITNFLGDDKLDIEISKVMQNKKTVGDIYVSIDPYDYMTSSINQHDWRSCHRITDGEYGTGSVSYMLDETTLVAYRAKEGKDYSYNLYGYKFEGNSKSYRQLVYFDKDSCNIIFSREYPSNNTKIAKKIREMVEDQVASYLGIEESLWKVFNNKYEGKYEKGSSLPYHDVSNDYNFKMARLSISKEKVGHWIVGAKIPCMKCGDTDGMESGSLALCEDCE